MDCGNDTQIHLMGCEGVSRYAKGPKQDPTTLHVALAVPDVQEAKRELDRMGVKYCVLSARLRNRRWTLPPGAPGDQITDRRESFSVRSGRTRSARRVSA